MRDHVIAAPSRRVVLPLLALATVPHATRPACPTRPDVLFTTGGHVPGAGEEAGPLGCNENMADGRPQTAPAGSTMPRGGNTRHVPRAELAIIQERRLDTMVDELVNRESIIRNLEADVSVGVGWGALRRVLLWAALSSSELGVIPSW